MGRPTVLNPPGPTIIVTSSLVALLAAFSIVLVRVPLLTQQGTNARLLVLGVFALGIAWAYPRVVPGRIDRRVAVVLGGYVTFTFLAMIRGARQGVFSTPAVAALDGLTLVAIACFGALLLASAQHDAERRQRVAALTLAPAVYVGVNIALYIGRGSFPFAKEASSPASELPASLLGYLGVHIKRVDFLLSSGVNDFGAIAGAGLAAALILLKLNTLRRRWAALAAALCLIGILMCDSRAALLLSLAVAGGLMLPRARLSGLVALLPLSPPLVLGGLGLLAGSGLVSAFSRAGDDLLTGTGRLYIWESATNVLSNPSIDHLLGYGAGGQIASGASQHYAWVFGNTDQGFTVHNLALQSVLDMGYVGLAITIAAIWLAVANLERAGRVRPNEGFRALAAIVLVLVLAGFTEALPTYNFLDTMAVLVLVSGAAASARSSPEAAATPSAAPRFGRAVVAG